MLVKTLDGKNYKWNLPEKSKKRSTRNTSSYHTKAREVISELYPNCAVCEEVPITVEKGKKLYLDFYIPTLNMAVEVHGKQHYLHSAHFHGHLKNFLMACANDRKKKEWCELNNIQFVELSYKDDEEIWKSQIKI